MSELTREEIERLRDEEAAEAPSTSLSDNAWSFNQSFTGVRLKYNSPEEFLQGLADRANLYASDYEDAKREAQHYIATQTLFDFEAPVDEFVLRIIKELGLVHVRDSKRKAAKNLTDRVYPIARRLLPNQIFNAYKLHPEAFHRMEGICLTDSYVALDGAVKEFNAWIELDMPDIISPKDIHDELDYMRATNQNFNFGIRMAVRRAHQTAGRYRRKVFKMILKVNEIRKMTYGGLANNYPVTFHNVCKYIETYNINRLVEENAELHGAIALGLAPEKSNLLNERLQK